MSEKENEVDITEGSGSVYEDIGLPEPIIRMLFCELRVIAVRGQFYPVEIAIMRLVDDKPTVWSSLIYPALSWSQQILDASPIDLSSAPPAVDVARQVLDMIDQCDTGWVYSDSSSTPGLLERLLAEAEVGQIYKFDVLRADQIMQDDSGQRSMREQLRIRKRVSDDPVEEVQRLWTCYQAAHP